MWKEVYYKELDRNYEGKGKRILPYSVKCKDMEELEWFIQYLRQSTCLVKTERLIPLRSS